MSTARALLRSSTLTTYHRTPTTFATSRYAIASRTISTTPKLYRPNRGSEHDPEHEGTMARTSDTVRVEYPEESKLPRSAPVQGRGGVHNKRTLASFSLEGRVAVITGGARGLGLVMSQALVISGADVAIVDLNSMSVLIWL